jgi:hypothetical protein
MESGSTTPMESTGGGPARDEMDQALDIMQAQITVAARTHDAELTHTRTEASVRTTSVDDTFPGSITVPQELAEAAAPVVDLRSSSMLPTPRVRHGAALPALVAAAGGTPAVLPLLHWAVEHDLSLADLIQAVAALPSRDEV